MPLDACCVILSLGEHKYHSFMSYFLHNYLFAVPSSFSKEMSLLEFGTWMKDKNFLPEDDYSIIIGKVLYLLVYYQVVYENRVSKDSFLIQ